MTVVIQEGTPWWEIATAVSAAIAALAALFTARKSLETTHEARRALAAAIIPKVRIEIVDAQLGEDRFGPMALSARVSNVSDWHAVNVELVER